MQINVNKLPLSVQYRTNRYYKALITATNIYYVSYSESDENAATLCFDNKGSLLSGNYHATNALMMDIDENKYTWTSKTMSANIKNIILA
jgi:hypothetical protein